MKRWLVTAKKGVALLLDGFDGSVVNVFESKDYGDMGTVFTPNDHFFWGVQRGTMLPPGMLTRGHWLQIKRGESEQSRGVGGQP